LLDESQLRLGVHRTLLEHVEILGVLQVYQLLQRVFQGTLFFTVEATLLGNIGIQAIAAGEISGIPELRKAISQSFEQKTFLPIR
jgi:hypothetical protein